MEKFNFISGASSFLGGWCGTVPISVIIWYILHHKPIPGPDPDPWWRITAVGTLVGTVVGIVLSAGSPLVGLATGFAAGVVGASIVGKSSLSSIKSL
jgi:hypothetical protein